MYNYNWQKVVPYIVCILGINSFGKSFVYAQSKVVVVKAVK